MPSLLFTIIQFTATDRFYYSEPENEDGVYVLERTGQSPYIMTPEAFGNYVTARAQTLLNITTERDAAAAALKALVDAGSPKPNGCFDMREGAHPVTEYLDDEFEYTEALTKATNRNNTAIADYTTQYAALLTDIKLVARGGWCFQVDLNGVLYRLKYFDELVGISGGERVELEKV
ncbi:MAG: hypothetical protein SF123_09655 [Chloroflexota bacterium]|nr:hypothetical protein [Chloroflexota bacterium]